VLFVVHRERWIDRREIGDIGIEGVAGSGLAVLRFAILGLDRQWASRLFPWSR
jgi:hypothetical protein